MRWRCFFLGCVFACVVCFGLLQSGFIDVVNVNAATYTDGTFLTVQETLESFGSSIDVTYFNGTEYVDTSATYVNSLSPTWRETLAVLDYPELMQGTLLHYTANLNGINSNNSYITLRLYPQYSIFDTDKIYTYIAIKSYGVSPSAYQSPSWRWFWNGSEINVEPFAGYTGTYYPRFENFNGDPYVFIPVRLESQSLTSGYSLSCQFNGGVLSSCDIYIQCPYVSLDAYGSSGTFDNTTSVTNDINVTVDVDLEETNGLLDGILDTIGGLGDMLLGLFIPSEEFLEDWIEAMQQLLEDHLGGLYEAIDEITSSFSGFSSVTAKQSFHVDACNIPLAGATLTLGNWDVPLKTNALPQLFYDALAYLIDFLATAAFLNMCKRKIELFLNPDNEVV